MWCSVRAKCRLVAILRYKEQLMIHPARGACNEFPARKGGNGHSMIGLVNIQRVAADIKVTDGYIGSRRQGCKVS